MTTLTERVVVTIVQALCDRLQHLATLTLAGDREIHDSIVYACQQAEILRTWLEAKVS